MLPGYKYYITSGSGTVEVFPINGGLNNVTYERSIESAAVFEKRINENLTFEYSSPFDFKAQELSDPIEELTLAIKQKCEGDYIDFLELVFTIADGSFDDDKCIYQLKSKTKEEFQKDIPVNIITLQNRAIWTGSYTQGVYVDPLGTSYQQAFYFDKTVQYVAQKTNPEILGVISDFFQINPLNAFPLTVTNYWSQMFFSALSDIQFPIPSDLARTEFLTFKELMNDLNAMFDVFWFIDENSMLRIEHRIFFEGLVGLDLTVPAYAKDMRFTSRYKYDLGEFPKTERLEIGIQYAQVTYGYFANINKNTKTNLKKTTKIRTDYASILYYNAGSNDDGVFLFATDNAFTVPSMISTTSVPAGDGGQNDVLTPHYLFTNLHTYGRQDTGALFESGTRFQGYPKMQTRAGGFFSKSTKPIILQDEIEFNFCCTDELDTKKLVKTPFGDGAIHEKAVFNMKTNRMKMQLKYQTVTDAFLPSDLSDLALWLRGDVGVQASGVFPYTVTQWDDSSGLSRHAIAGVGTGPSAPPGYTGVLFNTSSKFLTTPSFGLFPSKRGTIFVLFEMGDITQEGVILSTNNTNPGDIFFDIGFFAGQIQTQNNAVVYPQEPYAFKNLFQLRRESNTLIRSRQNSRQVREYDNITAVINPQTIPNTQITVNPLILGFNANLTGGGVSDTVNIKEVIIYDRELTDLETEKVDLYLAKKGYYEIYTHF